MAIFDVETTEQVSARYRVEAATPEAAEAKFGDPQIDWEGVEQVEYTAFSVEVRRVTETDSPSG